MYYFITWISKAFSFIQELDRIHLSEESRDQATMMRSISEILLEGFIMLVVAICGVFLNISSVIYFAQLRQQRPFHRFVFLQLCISLALQPSTLTLGCC